MQSKRNKRTAQPDTRTVKLRADVCRLINTLWGSWLETVAVVLCEAVHELRQQSDRPVVNAETDESRPGALVAVNVLDGRAPMILTGASADRVRAIAESEGRTLSAVLNDLAAMRPSC